MRNHRIDPGELNTLLDAGSFDAEWYRGYYKDVDRSGLTPAEHFLLVGRLLNRFPSAAAFESKRQTLSRREATVGLDKPEFTDFGVILHDPLISVIVISFNSGKDLPTLFKTLERQTYSNFEVILVENGTEDNASVLGAFFDRSHYIVADNVGFAGGNNIALEVATGELIALINPDTAVEPTMLQHLLDAMRFDSSAAAVVPKINFFEKFIRLKINVGASFSIDKSEIVAGLSYRKIFVRTGSDNGSNIASDDGGVIELDMPYEGARDLHVSLRSREQIHVVEVIVGYTRNLVTIEKQTNIIDISIDEKKSGSARYLINNAGSGIRPDGTPYDRGFGEHDDGQFYTKAYVQAICGCAALIRRIAILDRDIFAEAFFAYFEDCELSNWLGSQGYRILYQPQAVVYHRHSESTEENSVLWQTLVGRSRKLYEIATSRDLSPLSDFSYGYDPAFQSPLRQKLKSLDRLVTKASAFAELVKPKRKTACVYNTYFSSMGGGEKHALDIAQMLSSNYDVYLASEQDFSISELETYFSVNLTGITKLVSNAIDTHFTSKFDLFVNSTFLSVLLPAAAQNIYIVSFPPPNMDARLLERYYFLHNSPFTARWALRYWGEHSGEVVLPILGRYDRDELINVKLTKSRLMLSVGRFTYEGHCKSHHAIVEAFNTLQDRSPEFADWRLKIVGSCDYSDTRALKYLEDLRRLASTRNVEILPNLQRGHLDTLYAQAAIYVHAAGLDVDVEQPERHEHFGITIFESMVNGCIPVVYGIGGPAEQVGALLPAETFIDQRGLEGAMSKVMRQVNEGNDFAESCREFALDAYRFNLSHVSTILEQLADSRHVALRT